jgi:alkanesulfonate monooxygenase SsuD/methylene tetrahydromethanopterin reductase-like flavin-dependent oxidoreductase (luciferase family)
LTLPLGIALGGAGDRRRWRRAFQVVERAERLGLDSVWLPESHFRPGATPSPLVSLAAFAARTERLRLATTSLLLSIHHPLRIAAEVAMLDVLSNGRVMLGLGRGFQPTVFRAFGVSAAEKRDRFDEALDAILRAWSGEPFTLDGTFFASRGEAPLQSALRPLQRPHPPLVVAAFGRKGLAQAARRGLPYLASPLETLAQLEENYAFWRERLAGRPDPARPAVPVMRVVYAAADDAEANRVREALAAEAPAATGSLPPAVARAAAAPAEDRLVVGTAAAVHDTLGRYRERLGMDLLVARTELPGASEAERDAALERLVGEVLPGL